MTQTWLTQEAADRLAAELAELEGPRRAEIVKKIEAAQWLAVRRSLRRLSVCLLLLQIYKKDL